MNPDLSLARRREIVAALRNGAVPRRGVELLVVGLDRFETAVDEELDRAGTLECTEFPALRVPLEPIFGDA